MTRENALLRLAGILQWVCLVVLILLPALIAVFAVMLPMTPVAVQNITGILPAAGSTSAQVWLSFAVGLLPALVLIWTLFQMRRLFLDFSHGQILTPDAGKGVRRIGQGFLVLALVPLIVHPVQSVLLSWAAGPGQRQISIGFSSDMLGFALVSGLLIVIGWALGIAADTAAENRSFV